MDGSHNITTLVKLRFTYHRFHAHVTIVNSSDLSFISPPAFAITVNIYHYPVPEPMRQINIEFAADL